jgi:hypothetical protein
MPNVKFLIHLKQPPKGPVILVRSWSIPSSTSTTVPIVSAPQTVRWMFQVAMPISIPIILVKIPIAVWCMEETLCKSNNFQPVEQPYCICVAYFVYYAVRHCLFVFPLRPFLVVFINRYYNYVSCWMGAWCSALVQSLSASLYYTSFVLYFFLFSLNCS